MSPKPTVKPITAIPIEDRCKYVAASGRRCRANVARDTSRTSGYSAFCLPHSQMEQQFLDSKSVAKDLIGALDEFRTHISVSEVLGKLLVLVAENRIPLRNATTIAYICQLLTVCNSGVRYEINLRSGRAGELHVINRAVDMVYGEDDDDEDDASKNEKNNEPPQKAGQPQGAAAECLKPENVLAAATRILQGR